MSEHFVLEWRVDPREFYGYGEQYANLRARMNFLEQLIQAIQWLRERHVSEDERSLGTTLQRFVYALRREIGLTDEMSRLSAAERIKAAFEGKWDPLARSKQELLDKYKDGGA